MLIFCILLTSTLTLTAKHGYQARDETVLTKPKISFIDVFMAFNH